MNFKINHNNGGTDRSDYNPRSKPLHLNIRLGSLTSSKANFS